MRNIVKENVWHYFGAGIALVLYLDETATDCLLKTVFPDNDDVGLCRSY